MQASWLRVTVQHAKALAFPKIQNRRRPMHIAIYTAIFGSYDDLKRPAQQLGVDADFYCFSDGGDVRPIVQGWRYINVPTDAVQHPRMQAKYFKILSHKVFPSGRLAFRYSRSLSRRKYDAIIWVDASLQIKGDRFAQNIGSMCEKNVLLVYKHPDRTCISEEVVACQPWEKYDGLPLDEQVSYYFSQGLTAPSGLFACGVIGRGCPESREAKRFNEAWWAENMRWTYQDQLSFAFLAKRTKLKIGIIPGSLWQNEHFDFIAHRSRK